MFDGGLVAYFSKNYIDHKQKCKSNGFFIKGGYPFMEPSYFFIAAGWAYESFQLKNQRRSFNIELGGRVMPDSDFITARLSIIYLQLSWTWFVVGTWK
jgi:hypothetical protein